MEQVREGAIDVRLDPTFGNAAHDLFGPIRDLFGLAPKVPEV